MKGTITLTLPVPPSVNAIWRPHVRRGRVGIHKAPSYEAWQADAEAAFLQQGGRRLGRIEGAYALEVTIPDRYWLKRDVDNVLKAASDLLQRVGVVSNDRLCAIVTARFGPIPFDRCVVVLTPTSAPR